MSTSLGGFIRLSLISTSTLLSAGPAPKFFVGGSDDNYFGDKVIKPLGTKWTPDPVKSLKECANHPPLRAQALRGILMHSWGHFRL